MSYFDYKVIPAPRRVKRAKGLTAPEDLFALTLTEVINGEAHQGWEYVRAESMAAETPRGWFRSARVEEQTVLIFRRERETLGPRIERPAPGRSAGAGDREPHSGGPAIEPRPASPRQAMTARREPRIEEFEPAEVSPLRPEPRLGPAERG